VAAKPDVSAIRITIPAFVRYPKPTRSTSNFKIVLLFQSPSRASKGVSADHPYLPHILLSQPHAQRIIVSPVAPL